MTNRYKSLTNEVAQHLGHFFDQNLPDTIARCDGRLVGLAAVLRPAQLFELLVPSLERDVLAWTKGNITNAESYQPPKIIINRAKKRHVSPNRDDLVVEQFCFKTLRIARLGFAAVPPCFDDMTRASKTNMCQVKKTLKLVRRFAMDAAAMHVGMGVLQSYAEELQLPNLSAALAHGMSSLQRAAYFFDNQTSAQLRWAASNPIHNSGFSAPPSLPRGESTTERTLFSYLDEANTRQRVALGVMSEAEALYTAFAMWNSGRRVDHIHFRRAAQETSGTAPKRVPSTIHIGALYDLSAPSIGQDAAFRRLRNGGYQYAVRKRDTGFCPIEPGDKVYSARQVLLLDARR